jgi:UDP-GlcNAc:undecaprenyl-phosphate GlcNAc-1-phosphate transferase
VVALALGGAMLGFLWFNLPPASDFLGDCGSMLVGLVVGVLAIQGSIKGAATVYLTAPTALLTLPILDTLAAILRRKLTGRSIYCTDRGHLHHCLLRYGLTNRQALIWVVGLSLVTGVGALSSLWFGNDLLAVLSVATVVAILVVSRVFGHGELALAGQRAVATGLSLFRWHKSAEPRQIRVRLQGCMDWEQLWEQILEQAGTLNLVTVSLDVNAPRYHECYHARWERGRADADEPKLWRTLIPLAVHGRNLGQLEVVGLQDLTPVWQKIHRVARLAENCETAATVLTENVEQLTNSVPSAGLGVRTRHQQPVQMGEA